MGSKAPLWKLLDREGMLRRAEGERLVHDLGRTPTVAVDVDVWLFAAWRGPVVRRRKRYECREGLRLVFEKALQLLRFGVCPCFVFDGSRDPAKNRSRGFGPIPWMTEVEELVKAMGLQTMRAPGEAEATCAAMSVAGVVDACITSDFDALLYGATCVYKTLKLNYGSIKASHLVACQTALIKKGLQIKEGGLNALRLLAGLCGCDYNPGGVPGVGAIGAWKIVVDMLQGSKDDFDLLDKFWRWRCLSGHESNEGAEISRLRRALESEHVQTSLVDCFEALDRQQRRAETFVRKLHGVRVGWIHRPNVDAVANLMDGLWSRGVVRKKVLPILIEWDIMNPKAPGAEFVPTNLKRSRRGSWLYIAEIHRMSGCNEEDVDEDRQSLATASASQLSFRVGLFETSGTIIENHVEGGIQEKAQGKGRGNLIRTQETPQHYRPSAIQ